MKQEVFKTYDIRGLYPDEINEEAAYKIGQGLAQFFKAKKFMIARDIRLSSEALSNSVIRGITSQGVDIIDIGLSSTSCFYYTLANSLEADCGLIITASHLSKEFNGMKPMYKGAIPPTKEQLIEMKNFIIENKFSDSPNLGKIETKDTAEKYIEAVRNMIKKELKPLKVVIDPGNGMAGLYVEKVLAGTNLNVIPIYTELDGNFPNHETNPKIPENRKKISEKIKEENADLGFMFDGDADRLCAIDRNGEVIDPSLIMALISEYLVVNSSRKKILVETRTSRVVYDWVEKAGGKVEMTSCWTIPIKLKMFSDSEIVFGGETSGHYIFSDLNNTDDGILGMIIFLQAISTKEKNIDEINKEFKEKYFVIEETNFEINSKEKVAEILTKLEEQYSTEGGKILKVDGLSVIYSEWWFNLRASNSEPVIRLNLEANSKELMEEKRDELLNIIRR